MNTANISYRQILIMAIPVIVANFLLPLQSIIDTAVVGHFNEPMYLAGMAIAIQAFTIIAVSFNFLQYATSGLSAQAYGKQEAGNNKNNIDSKQIRKLNTPNQTISQVSHQSSHNQLLLILQRALCVALFLALFIMLLQTPIFNTLLAFFYSGEESYDVALQYLNIRIWSLIPELMNYAFIGFFVGQGRTKKILYQQLFISLTNVSLTLFFVYTLGLKIQGVAMATVIAQWLGLTLALYMVASTLQLPYHRLLNIYQNLSNGLFAHSELRKLFALNINIFTRTLLLVLSFAWITLLSAKMGELVLATNIILLQILTISSYMLDGVAVSAESLTGQCVGAIASSDQQNKVNSSTARKSFKTIIIRTAVASYGFAFILSIIWALIFNHYLAIMTNVQEVLDVAIAYKWYAVLLPLIGVGAYWIDGILFGLTNGDVIRKTSLYVTVIFLPCSLFLTQEYQLTGLWLSIWSLLILRFSIAGLGVYSQYKQEVFTAND